MSRPLVVMLVDANHADHALLGEALSELAVDADLVAYGDAAAFVTRLAAHVDLPDLLIIDLRMPRLDGLSVLERAAAAWPAVPIVVMSAAAYADCERRALAGRARAFLGKPARFSEYLVVVHQALGFARRSADQAG